MLLITVAHELGKLQCDICNSYQHGLCYGYWDAPSLSEFVCYSCLLQEESSLLGKMKVVCVKRRGLFFIGLNGRLWGKEIASFMSKYCQLVDQLVAITLTGLDCHYLEAETILGELEQQGLVERWGLESNQRFEDAKFSPGHDFEKLSRDYFSPTLNIAHHVSILIYRALLLTRRTNIFPSSLLQEPLRLIRPQPQVTKTWTYPPLATTVADSAGFARVRLVKVAALKERLARGLTPNLQPWVSRERHSQIWPQARLHMAKSVQRIPGWRRQVLEKRSSLALRGVRGSLDGSSQIARAIGPQG